MLTVSFSFCLIFNIDFSSSAQKFEFSSAVELPRKSINMLKDLLQTDLIKVTQAKITCALNIYQILGYSR